MNDVLKAIKERYSTRGYTAQKLDEETLNALISAGLQAPTAANRQEVHITVVDGQNPILAEIEAEKNILNNTPNPPHNFYYEAPVVMLLSTDRDFPWGPVDAGIAVQSIALAAESLGLGSLIIGCIKGAMRGEKEDYFAKALNFPENYQFEVAITVGYGAASKEPHEYSVEKNVNCL